MRTPLTLRLLAVPVIALAFVATSCGDDGGGGSDVEASGAIEEQGEALDGEKVTVGSKDFDENILLGKMMILALEAAGADVTDETNLGGTNVNRKALTTGDIDVYAEYNGTGWTEHLGQEDPGQDPEALYDKVAEKDLADNEIHWLGSSEFNNTYGFAVGPDLAEVEGDFTFDSMAAYLKENPDAKVCMETEFPDRSDGLVLWETATEFEIPKDQISILDTGVIYTETATGECDFGEIFTTDGRIEGLDLTVVEDPGVMIIYNVSFTVRDEAYQTAPEAYQAISEAILAELDNEMMAELNSLVSTDGEDPEKVAEDYLKEVGLIA